MKSYPGIYRARVLSNVDPRFLGRVRLEVYPMLIGQETAAISGNPDEGIATADLPWAVPAMSLFAGASNDGSGAFAVPEVNSYVFVFFEAGDIYQPCYFAEAQTAGAGLPAGRLTNYPYTKIWATAGGIVITINDSTGNEEIKVLHPSGTYLQIDSNGNVNISSEGSVNISGTTVNINP